VDARVRPRRRGRRSEGLRCRTVVLGGGALELRTQRGAPVTGSPTSFQRQLFVAPSFDVLLDDARRCALRLGARVTPRRNRTCGVD
jgi:hypothetical protein